MLLPLIHWVISLVLPATLVGQLSSTTTEAMAPPTNILDHIVHLAPNVKDATENLTKLGFKYVSSISHRLIYTHSYQRPRRRDTRRRPHRERAYRKPSCIAYLTITINSPLSPTKSFPDGTYIELISFTHDPSYYPPNSPERTARESHRWANKSPGWIDYAFLGNGVLDPPNRISDLVNARAAKHGGEPIYKAEVPGGRLRPDGVRLDWVITAGEEEGVLGLIPIFCGDVTERGLRVGGSCCAGEGVVADCF